jgi:hypothetical protein
MPKDSVLQGGGMSPVVSVAERGSLLDAITVDEDSADRVESHGVGVGALDCQLGVSLGTPGNWRKALSNWGLASCP